MGRWPNPNRLPSAEASLEFAIWPLGGRGAALDPLGPPSLESLYIRGPWRGAVQEQVRRCVLGGGDESANLGVYNSGGQGKGYPQLGPGSWHFLSIWHSPQGCPTRFRSSWLGWLDAPNRWDGIYVTGDLARSCPYSASLLQGVSRFGTCILPQWL